VHEESQVDHVRTVHLYDDRAHLEAYERSHRAAAGLTGTVESGGYELGEPWTDSQFEVQLLALELEERLVVLARKELSGAGAGFEIAVVVLRGEPEEPAHFALRIQPRGRTPSGRSVQRVDVASSHSGERATR
jgi:hypothetical protein